MPRRVNFRDDVSYRVAHSQLLSSPFVHWFLAWLEGFSKNSFHSLGVLANCETSGFFSDWMGGGGGGVEGDVLRGCLFYFCGRPREGSMLVVL